MLDGFHCSDNIADLAGALAKAQGQVKGAAKDSANPHFKSRYADLASVWDACRAALTANGLAVVQLPGREAADVWITTVLTHASGQWISSTLSAPIGQQNAQGIGSALTYLRRYSLAAMVGVAPDDDDGEAAMARDVPRQQSGPPKPAAPKPLPQAPSVAPPHDPETGEMKPHSIGVKPTMGGEGSDWVDFGRRYIAAIKGCTDTDTLVAWGMANGEALGNCEKQAPRVFASIGGAITKCRDELNMAAIAPANGHLPPSLEKAIERGITP